jgi:Ca2+-binding EF-hand superfamily protein
VRKSTKFLNSRGTKYANIRQIWNKYDDDHSGKMDIKEFIEFTKEIRLNIGTLTVGELYTKIDADKSGKIDFNEFVNYLEELTSAKEFEADFNLYAGKKGYLDIKDLVKFMKEVQREEHFEIYEAIHMILFYNKEIDIILNKEMEEKLEK